TISLYKIYQLYTLLYIDIVILLILLHIGIKLYYLKRILHLIEDIQQEYSTEDPFITDFLIWATVLSAITIRFTEL
ncbi:hypothetical protein EDB80DRAFT_590371, partial [Ilyonectria destructans]